MKKKLEYCDRCRKETTHRHKSKSYFSNSKKDKGYSTGLLPTKCMTCGYEKGRYIRQKVKKTRHVKI